VWGALLSCLVVLEGRGQSVDLRGQASALARAASDPVLNFRSDFRYIPTAFGAIPVSDDGSIDGELSVDLHAWGIFSHESRPSTDAALDLYRSWLRWAAPRFEVRAGLQRISFGSATLFRPLMWFDAIDPRDPLQITKGVYALLGRYYASSTANLWLWGVYGQDEIKGWELIPTRKGSVEFGGRFQFPAFSGEAGLTYHHRTAEAGTRLPTPSGEVRQTVTIPENRIGIDGKWDIGPGIWIEGTLTRQETDAMQFPWQNAVTLGSDYTFAVGNGLTVLGEWFVQSYTGKVFTSGPTASVAGLSASYPVTIVDEVSAILYFDTKNTDLYTYAGWQRTYDDWVIHLIFFANPRRLLLIAPAREGISLPGNGGMVMVVFNH